MNILIITLYGNFNYGNRFQNYAMQNVLQKFESNVSTLANSKIVNEKKKEKLTLKRLISNVVYFNRKLLLKKRIGVFEKFSDKYINKCDYEDTELIKKEFDIVCIGSDQIWNPYFYDDFYYSFGKFSKNVFSYAASFGIENVPDIYKEEIKEGLNNVKSISVREDRGAEIVKDLVGRNAEVVVDPTLLLTDEEWDKIVEIPKILPKKKYILTYFLGICSKERREYIESFAKENDLEMVNLGQIEYKKYYNVSPSEFLYFLKNSELVLTDSFHGSVFSIIYKKPFYIMKREDENKSMTSRIDTLLNKFELEDRQVNNYSKKLELNCDFSKVSSILEIERKKAMEFLEKAVNNNH